MDKMEQAKRLFFEALSAQEKGELIAAERRYEDALALAPNRPSLMNNLAVVYIQSAKYLQARSLCERCVAIDPSDRHAPVHLGISRVKLNARLMRLRRSTLRWRLRRMIRMRRRTAAVRCSR